MFYGHFVLVALFTHYSMFLTNHGTVGFYSRLSMVSMLLDSYSCCRNYLSIINCKASKLVQGRPIFDRHTRPALDTWCSWSTLSAQNPSRAVHLTFIFRKSVAHLPWKAFMYKAFNTFIDDVFAFIIKMPTTHRIACFRDDIVFFCYLYQVSSWTSHSKNLFVWAAILNLF